MRPSANKPGFRTRYEQTGVLRQVRTPLSSLKTRTYEKDFHFCSNSSLYGKLSEYIQDAGYRHGQFRPFGGSRRRFLPVRHGRLAEEQPAEARIFALRLVRRAARQQREAHQRAFLGDDQDQRRAGKRRAEDFGPLQDGSRFDASERRGRRAAEERRRGDPLRRGPRTADRHRGQTPHDGSQSVLRRGRAGRSDEQRHQCPLYLAVGADDGQPRLLPRS